MNLGWKVGAIGLAAIAGACVAIGIWRWSLSIEQAIGDFMLALSMLGLSFVVLSIGTASGADDASLSDAAQRAIGPCSPAD